MYSYDVKEISPTEYQVIETSYVNYPEFVLARCSGPVPAWDIVYAMRVAQSLYNSDSIRNTLSAIDSAVKIYEQEIKSARLNTRK
jgi:hypothetical protein